MIDQFEVAQVGKGESREKLVEARKIKRSEACARILLAPNPNVVVFGRDNLYEHILVSYRGGWYLLPEDRIVMRVGKLTARFNVRTLSEMYLHVGQGRGLIGIAWRVGLMENPYGQGESSLLVPKTPEF